MKVEQLAAMCTCCISSIAYSARYTIYDASDKIILRSVVAPIDMSQSISVGMTARFPNAHLHLIVSPEQSNCSEIARFSRPPPLTGDASALPLSAPARSIRSMASVTSSSKVPVKIAPSGSAALEQSDSPPSPAQTSNDWHNDIENLRPLSNAFGAEIALMPRTTYSELPALAARMQSIQREVDRLVTHSCLRAAKEQFSFALQGTVDAVRVAHAGGGYNDGRFAPAILRANAHVARARNMLVNHRCAS